MLEFLFKYNNIITHIIEGMAAVVGILCLKKYNKTPAIFFITIVVYLFFIDLIGSFLNLYGPFKLLNTFFDNKTQSNLWWYTLSFDIVLVIFFVIFYLKIIKSSIKKRIIKYGGLLFFIISIILISSDLNKLFNGNFPVIWIFGGILIIICSAMYFIQILQDDKLLSFSTSLYFYISVAIFLWWLIVTPLVFYDEYAISADLIYIQLKRWLIIFANIFMYLTFAIGLIVSKPEKIE